MYHPIGITNGNQTLINQRLAHIAGQYGDMWLPACWVGFWFDLFVIITFFAFKSQRQFPATIFGWMCCVDCFQFLRELVKGSPIPYINEEFFWTPTQTTCAVIYLWVVIVEAMQFVLAITLAVIIYQTVVKKVDVTYDANPRFMRSVVTIFILYAIIYTVIVGSVAYAGGGYNAKGATCAPYSLGPSIIGICQCFIGVSILIIFLGISLKYPMYSLVDEKEGQQNIYIWRVVTNARGLSDSSQNKRAWITIRFLLVIFLQAGSRIAFNLYYLVQAIGSNKKNYEDMGLTDSDFTKELIGASWEASVLVWVFYYLNALVVLWANKALQQWIYKKYSYLSSNGMPTASTEVDDPKDHPLVEFSSSPEAKIDVSTSNQDSFS